MTTNRKGIFGNAARAKHPWDATVVNGVNCQLLSEATPGTGRAFLEDITTIAAGLTLADLAGGRPSAAVASNPPAQGK